MAGGSVWGLAGWRRSKKRGQLLEVEGRESGIESLVFPLAMLITEKGDKQRSHRLFPRVHV